MTMKFKLLLFTLAFSFTALLANANNGGKDGGPGVGEDNKKNDIVGGVINAGTKKPIGNVNVVAYTNSKKEKTVLTDANGNYYFDDLKPGTYKFVFEKNGYRKVVKEKVTIRADEGCQLNIEMEDEDDLQIIPGTIFSGFEEE